MFECIEASIPIRMAPLDPDSYLFEFVDAGCANTFATGGINRNEATCFEYPDLLRDRWPTDIKVAGDGIEIARGLGEQYHNLAPGRVGYGLKCVSSHCKVIL